MLQSKEVSIYNGSIHELVKYVKKRVPGPALEQCKAFTGYSFFLI